MRILPINVGRANVQNSLDFLPHFQLIGTSEDACAIVGDVSRNKDYYVPQNRNQKFYDLLNGEYKSVSSRFGTIGDSATSEYLNQKLEKNEGNIKNWVKGVPNNE